MKLTFKQYLMEIEMKNQIAHVAKDLLGTLDFTTSREIDDDLLDKARQTDHKFVNSALGPWVVSVFKTASKTFAQVMPPRGSKGDDAKPIYLFPRDQS